MGLFSRKPAETPWRESQKAINSAWSNPVSSEIPPPPFPPNRSLRDMGAETDQSIRNREDYETYMLGYSHGMALARRAN